jgi:hypothetical protein
MIYVCIIIGLVILFFVWALFNSVKQRRKRRKAEGLPPEPITGSFVTLVWVGGVIVLIFFWIYLIYHATMPESERMERRKERYIKQRSSPQVEKVVTQWSREHIYEMPKRRLHYLSKEERSFSIIDSRWWNTGVNVNKGDLLIFRGNTDIDFKIGDGSSRYVGNLKDYLHKEYQGDLYIRNRGSKGEIIVEHYYNRSDLPSSSNSRKSQQKQISLSSGKSASNDPTRYLGDSKPMYLVRNKNLSGPRQELQIGPNPNKWINTRIYVQAGDYLCFSGDNIDYYLKIGRDGKIIEFFEDASIFCGRDGYVYIKQLNPRKGKTTHTFFVLKKK